MLMDNLYRQAAYALAVVAFAVALVLPTFEIVPRGGLVQTDATLLGLLLVALGLWLGTVEEGG
jgi:hypothetical protein